MDEKIIQFPVTDEMLERLANRGKFSIESVVKQIGGRSESLKHHHVEEAIDMVLPEVFQKLTAMGFDIQNPHSDSFNIKDSAFLGEILRAILLRRYNIKHPFQKMISKSLIEDHENEYAFSIADKINMVLNKKKVVN